MKSFNVITVTQMTLWIQLELEEKGKILGIGEVCLK